MRLFFLPWRGRPRVLWLLGVALLVGLDQLSKAHFARLLPLGTFIEVTPWFNLVHTLNEGAAFSFLADAGGWQRWFLVAVGLLVVGSVSLVCLSPRVDPADRWIGGLVVAGGAGNLVDRIQTGAVVDFLDLHWRGWHWPAFNLADVFIVGAALAWLLLSLPWPAALRRRPTVPEVRP